LKIIFATAFDQALIESTSEVSWSGRSPQDKTSRISGAITSIVKSFSIQNLGIDQIEIDKITMNLCGVMLKEPSLFRKDIGHV